MGRCCNCANGLSHGTWALSDDIDGRYFSHASAEFRTVHA